MTMYLRRIALLLILCGLALPESPAATATDGARGNSPLPPGRSTGELDEVAVIGKKLRELKRDAVKAEDRFYARFNELNTQDDFDIHCHMDRATGTKIPQRLCRIRFLADAGAVDAQEFYRALTSASAGRGVYSPEAALQPLWLQRREEYRRTARALLEKHPELLTLATEWVRLREQYERVHTQRHETRVFVFE